MNRFARSTVLGALVAFSGATAANTLVGDTAQYQVLSFSSSPTASGSGLVGGQGGTAPDFTFGALYRLTRWDHGRVNKVLAGGTLLSKTENPAKLLL